MRVAVCIILYWIFICNMLFGWVVEFLYETKNSAWTWIRTDQVPGLFIDINNALMTRGKYFSAYSLALTCHHRDIIVLTNNGSFFFTR